MALIRTAGDDQEQAEEGSSSNQEDSQTHLLAKIWRRLYELWSVVDEHLAHILGLDQSRYQWAVDEYFQQKEKEQSLAEAQENEQNERISELELGRQ